MTDTTTEAVERLAKDIQTIRWPLDEGCKLREDAAATLRALAQERDRVSEYWKDCAASRSAWIEKYDAMQTERDAARAEVKTLRALLERAQEELRRIHLKDTGAIYDIGLRVAITAALAAKENEQ